MAQFFLIYGAPVLAEQPSGRAWVSLLLQRCFDEVEPASLVVCGGGVGPERWAIEQADECGLHWEVYGRDGYRYASRESNPRRPPQRWAPAGVTGEQQRGALIDAAQRARDDGDDVLVLVFHEPWGPDEDAAMMLDQALAAGLCVERVRVGAMSQPGAEA